MADGVAERSSRKSPGRILHELLTGHYASCAIYVAAELRVADLIASGLRTRESIASRTGTNPIALGRVLRLLVVVGLLEEDQDGFTLTPVGRCLCEDAENSMRAAALMLSGPAQMTSWADLLEVVKTGEPAFVRRTGIEPFEYLARNPVDAARCDAAMAAYTQIVAQAVALRHDFAGIENIVDVGGGVGALAIGIMKRHAHVKGTILELAHVVERAQQYVDMAGLAARTRVVAGDFFREIPAGADAYLLKHVLHDWDDDRAVAILRKCRDAMPAHAQLLVVEHLYLERGDASDTARRVVFNDVEMMVATGGRERSRSEFQAILARAGLSLKGVLTMWSLPSVLVATRPAPHAD